MNADFQDWAQKLNAAQDALDRADAAAREAWLHAHRIANTLEQLIECLRDIS